MDERIVRLLAWVEAEAKRAPSLLVPVSGGSDSALVFWLLSRKYAAKTIGVFVGAKENLRERAWFENIGRVDTVEQPACGDPEAARWALLSVRSRTENAWLVGSRNRSEHVFGTFSLASRAATFLPIAGVWKSDVMRLCAEVGVPDSIVQSSRKADPACGRPAELAEIGLESVDLFLKVKAGELDPTVLTSLASSQVEYLERVFHANQFRRYLPVCGPLV